jgi:hypothetical protein
MSMVKPPFKEFCYLTRFGLCSLPIKKDFETLNRILLQQKRYSPKTSFDSAKSSPLNSDQARKEKIQGKVVVTVIINSVGQPAKIC